MDLDFLIRKSNNIIKDTQISYTDNWQKKHWKSIESAYNSSPFFTFYRDEIYPIFMQKKQFLLDFSLQLQNKILEILNIEYETNLTITYIKETDKVDLRAYQQINNKPK